MPDYRRSHIPGATYFFTVNLAKRGTTTLTDNIDTMRFAFGKTVSEHPLHVDAIVVLPDHIHSVWTLPDGDSDFSIRWRKIKARFSHLIDENAPRSRSKIAKLERGIWQRRFWEHRIRDAHDYQMHVRYCWLNPVKHGFVERASEWPYSSIHRDIERGIVDRDVA